MGMSANEPENSLENVSGNAACVTIIGICGVGSRFISLNDVVVVIIFFFGSCIGQG